MGAGVGLTEEMREANVTLAVASFRVAMSACEKGRHTLLLLLLRIMLLTIVTTIVPTSTMQ